MAKHVVAAVSEIRAGRAQAGRVNGRAIVLFNLSGRVLRAVQRCPHQAATCAKASSPAWSSPRSRASTACRAREKFSVARGTSGKYDIRTGKSWCDPRSVRVRNSPVTVEPGARLILRC